MAKVAANPVLARAVRQKSGGDQMGKGINRQILLMETPSGKLAADHFSLNDGQIPTPKDGEVLLKIKLF